MSGMQSSPVLSYSEQKSIFDILGSNALILNEQGEIEMASRGIFNILHKEENEIIGKKCFDILCQIFKDCQFCKIFNDKGEIKNLSFDKYCVINNRNYLVKCSQILAENNKYLVLLKEIKNRFSPGRKYKQTGKSNYLSYINEYGVFLKIFKESNAGLAVVRKRHNNEYIITTYNDRFKEDFNITNTNIFIELFVDFPLSWLVNNLSEPFYEDFKQYESYFYKPCNRFYNFYFKFLSSNLLLLTSVESTESVNLQRTMINSIYDSIEKERERIARDLHDGLGSLLSSIAMRMNVLKSGRLSSEKTQNIIQNTSDLVDMALNTTREITHNIQPYELKDSDFRIAVSTYIDKIKKASGIDIYFDDKKFDTLLDEKKEIHLFRIICELINNTIKHSGANLIDIKLSNINKRICFQYRDNGIGFNTKNIGRSGYDNMGIKNIVYRTQDMNGAYNFFSEPGSGMKFKMVI